MDITKSREVRCQAIVLKHNSILIIEHYNSMKHQTFCLLPGGGKEIGETEDACILRELKEETNLDVEIIQVLFDEVIHQWGYERYKTYLCIPKPDSIEKIGQESNHNKQITKLIWQPLNEECPEFLSYEQFCPSLTRIKEVLKQLSYL